MALISQLFPWDSGSLPCVMLKSFNVAQFSLIFKYIIMQYFFKQMYCLLTVVDPGGQGGHGPPPGPVKINHKKDGRQRRPHRFHISWAPYPAAGSVTD